MPRGVRRAYNECMEGVIETACKTALHRHNSKWLPYKYDINVYRGCAHRCTYCYALYSHEYLGAGSFYDQVYAKTNIADVLRRELPKFSRETVNLGGVTDSYQPAERTLCLMPAVLKLLSEYGVSMVISTKSTLILRDIELLKRVDEAAGASIAFTVTTADKRTSALIEPGASPSGARMDAVRTLSQEGLSCGVHLMPIIPFLTSGAESLEAVFAAAKEAGARYVLTGALNLKTSTRRHFFDSVRQVFPSEYARIAALYRDKEACRSYRQQLFETIAQLRKKYAMPAYALPKVKQAPEQLKFT